MIIFVSKKQVPYGLGLLYLAMVALLVGSVMSANSATGLIEDPASGFYTTGFMVGLFMSLGGVLGIFKCAMPKSEWQPKKMDPLSRPWRLRTPCNAAIFLGLMLLAITALPVGIFAIGWSSRINWVRIDVPTDRDSVSKPSLVNGSWDYSFRAAGKFYWCSDKVGAPLPAKTQTIWYNPRGKDCHIGDKPPFFNPIIFGFFLVALFLSLGFFTVILLRTLRQMRANDAMDLAERSLE